MDMALWFRIRIDTVALCAHNNSTVASLVVASLVVASLLCAILIKVAEHARRHAQSQR